jgi:uncharacterized OB-fold protein
MAKSVKFINNSGGNLTEYCPHCGKPYIYVGDAPAHTDLSSVSALDIPWCTCNGIPDVEMTEKVTYTHSAENLLPMGWICPRCGRVNNPRVNQCPCTGTLQK